MKRPIAFMAVVLACVLVGLASLGALSTTTTVTVTHTATPVTACPPGASVMGCSLGAQDVPVPAITRTFGVTRPVTGCLFPDVSSYQGHPDWAAAAGSICAAVAKVGESTSIIDPDFAWNVTRLRALHIPWGGYWFVRDCTDGALFVHELAAVGFKGDRDALRPVLDMEVASARGCAVPIADAVHHAFGVWPIIYTAPGTWPGGSSGGLDSWEADYTTAPAPERLPFTSVVLGWQRYSPPYLDRWLPGLGYVDVSIDLRGFSKQLAFPAPPPAPPVHTITTPTPAPPPAPPANVRAKCWGKHATPDTRICKTVYRRHAWLVDQRITWGRSFRRCEHRASALSCDHAWHWYETRRHQAVSLRARYS